MFFLFVMCHLLEPAACPGVLSLGLQGLPDAKWKTMPINPFWTRSEPTAALSWSSELVYEPELGTRCQTEPPLYYLPPLWFLSPAASHAKYPPGEIIHSLLASLSEVFPPLLCGLTSQSSFSL